jgi:hypothetical protein
MLTHAGRESVLMRQPRQVICFLKTGVQFVYNRRR